MINYKQILFLCVLSSLSIDTYTKTSTDLEFSEIEAADLESLDLDNLLEDEKVPSRKTRSARGESSDAIELDSLLEESEPDKKIQARRTKQESSDLRSLENASLKKTPNAAPAIPLDAKNPLPKKNQTATADSLELDPLIEKEAPKDANAQTDGEFESLDLDDLLETEAIRQAQKSRELSLPKNWKANKKLEVSKKRGGGLSSEDMEVLRLEKLFEDDRLREHNLQRIEGRKIIDLGAREKIEQGLIEKKLAKKKSREKTNTQGSSKLGTSAPQINQKAESDFNFSLGEEEKKLLNLARYVEKKLPNKEWDEIATQASNEKYIVQPGDWLWKISDRLFGTGFYYSKLWSINPHITNPHQIEPGMVLTFTTGNSDELPEVTLGTFEETGEDEKHGANYSQKIAQVKKGDPEKSAKRILKNLKKYGDNIEPPWMKERKKLLRKGTYFDYASEATYEDLEEIGKLSLTDDYKKYNPPVPDIIIVEPPEESVGFDKSSIVDIDIKEGLSLTTFLTKDAIIDLGQLTDFSENGPLYAAEREITYAKFNDNDNIQVGDIFSIYKFEGMVHYKFSDRRGYRHTIVGHIKVVKKLKTLWEVEINDIRDMIPRDARLTYYVPKLRKSISTYNRRNIEASIIGTYLDGRTHASLGDVVYIDRGRSDGVEMGNIFNIYSFLKNAKHEETPKRTIGSLRIVTLMDDFATALITSSSDAIPIGALASTEMTSNAKLASANKKLQNKDDVNIEMHLKDSVKDILSNAKNVKLTEDELKELERQEKKYTVLSDDERDIRELERLEREIVAAEKRIAEARNDEDKFLERQNLNQLEKQRTGQMVAEDFAPVNDIEGEVGLKFLDQDLNARDNPYGLSEFDLEEIDELYNRIKL